MRVLLLVILVVTTFAYSCEALKGLFGSQRVLSGYRPSSEEGEHPPGDDPDQGTWEDDMSGGGSRIEDGGDDENDSVAGHADVFLAPAPPGPRPSPPPPKGNKRECLEDGPKVYDDEYYEHGGGGGNGGGSGRNGGGGGGGGGGGRPSGGGGERPNEEFGMDDCSESEDDEYPSPAPVQVAPLFPSASIEEPSLQEIFCQVSIAVPKLEGFRRGLSTTDYLTAVANTMNSIVDSNEMFFVEGRRSLEMLDMQFLHYSAARSRIHSANISFIEPNADWWVNIVAYIVTATDTEKEEIGQTLMEVVSSSVDQGDFLEELRQLEANVYAVAVPGKEEPLNIIFGEPNEGEMLDVSQWDIRRWVGLGMFGFTLMFTVFLAMVARHRRKVQEEQEHWGLATERGVSHLLNYAWDGKMVYNKDKLGYRDDDSMLIGGYHQGAHSAPDTVLGNSSQTDAPPTDPIGTSSGTGS